MKNFFFTLFVFFLLFGITSCKIVRHSDLENSENAALVFGADFDATEYVESVWDTEIFPYVESKSVDMHLVIEALKNNAAEDIEKYGYRAHAESPYTFSVKGKAVISRIDTTSRNGLAYIAFDSDPATEYAMQIGPVMKGSAIRDFLDFISLNSFQNQVEYAQVALQFNNLVYKNILRTIDFENSIDKKIDVIVLFTYTGSLDSIVLSPAACVIEE